MTNSNPRQALSYFDVVLNYGGNFPVFKDRVQARDEDHSKLIARFNAESKGYPKNVQISFETVKSI